MMKVADFLKVYLTFLSLSLLVNLLFLEIIFGSTAIPEYQEEIEQKGWWAFLYEMLVGVSIFYALFSLAGSLVFIKKRYEPKKMGLLSLALGFLFEFTFMRPDWVQNIYALRIGGGDVVAVLVSSLYWFIPWSVPSYILNKFVLTKE
ncbi:hypothetical protein DRN62_02455 [Nanoarchaeota archaeon]|nr:MAG: hypothetical protein DRN62_02455 [Nanoarchaeota archaeon]